MFVEKCRLINLINLFLINSGYVRLLEMLDYLIDLIPGTPQLERPVIAFKKQHSNPLQVRQSFPGNDWGRREDVTV